MVSTPAKPKAPKKAPKKADQPKQDQPKKKNNKENEDSNKERTEPTDDRPKTPQCADHSFEPSTRVLMADGTTRPISEVGIGDRVVATDPETGETTSRPVTMLHLNRDIELTDVTVSSTPAAAGVTAIGEGEGDRSTRGPTSTVLQTTQNHPFWDATTGTWTDASDLIPGTSTLVGPDGQLQYVTKVHNHTGAKDMRDLTVATIHTYYVVAGTTLILVHNANCAKLTPDQQKDIAKWYDGMTKVKGNFGKATVYEIKKPGAGMPRYYSPDLDQHHGGVFKGADRIEDLWKKETRSGTYGLDIDDNGMVAGLIRVGD